MIIHALEFPGTILCRLHKWVLGSMQVLSGLVIVAFILIPGCAHRNLGSSNRSDSSTLSDKPVQVIGKMPIEEARPIQLGMMSLFPEIEKRKAYTSAMMPAVEEAMVSIKSQKNYDHIIDRIAKNGTDVNQTLPQSRGFGHYRYDKEAHHPELIEIFGEAFLSQKFSTLVLRQEKSYGSMISFLESAKSRFAKIVETTSVVQHHIPVEVNGKTKLVPGTIIEYVSNPKESTYARLIHSDPEQRESMGFGTDDELRTWVRAYQNRLLAKIHQADPEGAFEICARISYLEYTSVFFARGSSGNTTAFLLACLKSSGWEFTAFKDLPDFLAFGLPFDEFLERLRSGDAFL